MNDISGDGQSDAAVNLSSLVVVVLTLNEEANLPACLDSLQKLAGRLLVVDSGSTDRSTAIALEAGATVLEHPFENYAAQRNWAQEHLPWTSSWLLHLDADERLTPELVSEINATVQTAPPEAAGFMLRKRTVFMGRWIKHGGHYPTYHLRLYRSGKGRCEPRLYDQHFVVDGEVRKLAHDYVDVLTADLTTWTMRHARWATLEAREVLQPSQAPGLVQPIFFGSPIERRRWLRNGLYYRAPLFLRAFLYWWYRYFVRLGFLDGTEGLIFHFLQGFWYRFLVDAKIWELRRQGADSPTTGGGAMADATALTSQLARDIADDLDYLEHRFAELEVIAQGWASQSSEDKNDFLFGWAIVEDRLQTLQRRVEPTSIPTRQQSRYHDLIARIAGDRPLLDRMRQT